MIVDLVSIISPCYNGEKYVECFLKSVLEQSYENIELIIVDDGSTDNTLQILKKYEDAFKRRGYLYSYVHQENRGQAAAINVGLSMYQGEYLMWVDSDDILMKDHVLKKVDYLRQHSECGMVVCEGIVVNSKELGTPLSVMKRKKPKKRDNFFKDLINEKNVVYCPAAIMARRIAMQTVVPSNHIFESRQGQNWQLMLPLAHTYKCGYLEEILFKCVAHEDSHSRTPRTYEQQIERYNQFAILINETINNIVDMTEKEKRYWNYKVNEKYDMYKLYLAYCHKKNQDVNEMRIKIQTYTGRKSWKYSYWGYILQRLCIALESRVNRFLNSYNLLSK